MDAYQKAKNEFAEQRKQQEDRSRAEHDKLLEACAAIRNDPYLSKVGLTPVVFEKEYRSDKTKRYHVCFLRFRGNKCYYYQRLSASHEYHRIEESWSLFEPDVRIRKSFDVPVLQSGTSIYGTVNELLESLVRQMVYFFEESNSYKEEPYTFNEFTRSVEEDYKHDLERREPTSVSGWVNWLIVLLLAGIGFMVTMNL